MVLRLYQRAVDAKDSPGIFPRRESVPALAQPRQEIQHATWSSEFFSAPMRPHAAPANETRNPTLSSESLVPGSRARTSKQRARELPNEFHPPPLPWKRLRVFPNHGQKQTGCRKIQGDSPADPDRLPHAEAVAARERF